MRRIKHFYYLLLLRPYYSLRRWYRFQKEIYSFPRESRHIFWAIQQEVQIAKAQMSYDLGVKMYGDFKSSLHPKEFNGLGDILK